ncbi:hypothetical protein SAMN05216312_11675 [Cohnella sp. OV330]|uniref:hypothetical protein n=1 Tax=Cohnella sp. OV330 TaxID=1855288 RepID=UPI0008E810B8|nr:hypothetical protein [Cohnella sp. OV330]SFB60062.1 hypothetical protein SAMN05216312_11675 [Cohnella sp. OV330]
MLNYSYDEAALQISESANENDMEFRIVLATDDPSILAGLKQVRQEFDENRVYTDVLFYHYPDREYKIIVRKDYYVDFVLELMKQRLLKSVAWAED